MLNKITILLLTLFIYVQAQEVVPYRIRMPNSTYSAQLRGKTGDRSAGITLPGTYSSTFKAHQFNVSVSGRYDLWFDANGGTNYSKDASWSGQYGKYISTDKFDDAIDADLDYKVDAVDDSILTLANMTQATINYIGSGGTVTNNPDDITIENVNATQLGVKRTWFSAQVDSNFEVRNFEIDPTMNDVQIQALFDEVRDSQAQLNIIKAKKGTLNTNSNFLLTNTNNLIMDLDGLTWDFGAKEFIICGDSTLYDTWSQTVYTDIISAYGVPLDSAGTWFPDGIVEGQSHQRISDSTDIINYFNTTVEPLKRNDIFVMSDDQLSDTHDRGFHNWFTHFFEDTATGYQYMGFRMKWRIAPDAANANRFNRGSCGGENIMIANGTWRNLDQYTLSYDLLLLENMDIRRDLVEWEEKSGWVQHGTYTDVYYVNPVGRLNNVRDVTGSLTAAATLTSCGSSDGSWYYANNGDDFPWTATGGSDGDTLYVNPPGTGSAPTATEAFHLTNPYTIDSLNYAFQAIWVRSQMVNNYYVEGFIKNGGGYGYHPRHFESVIINGFRATNQRHHLSTGTNHGQSQLVSISNAYVQQTYPFNGYQTAFDTHANNYLLRANNVTIMNNGTGFSTRGRATDLSDIHYENVSVGLSISPDTDGTNDSAKYYIRMDGIFMKNCSRVYQITTGSRVKKMEIRNLTFDSRDTLTNVGQVSLVFDHQSGTYIDSLIMSDVTGDIETVQVSQRWFNLLTGAVAPIEYLELNDCTFRGGEYFFYNIADRLPDYTRINGCKFSTMLHFVGVDDFADETGTEYMQDFVVNDSEFEYISYWWNSATSSDTLRFGDLRVENSHFDWVGYMFRRQTYFLWDKIEFNNNVFKATSYGDGSGWAMAPGLVDTLEFNHNIMNGYTKSEHTWITNNIASIGWIVEESSPSIGGVIVGQGAANLREFTGVPHINMIGNTFHAPLGFRQYANFDSCSVNVVGNHFLGYAYADNDYYIRFQDCTGFVTDNTIHVGGGNYDVLVGTGSASNLVIDGNSFYHIDAGNHTANAIDVTDGTFTLGLNRFYHFTNPIDTAGVAALDTMRVFQGMREY
jgi:hypothetical protein